MKPLGSAVMLLAASRVRLVPAALAVCVAAASAWAAPAAGAAQRVALKHHTSRPAPLQTPAVSLRVLTPDQVNVLQTGAFTVRVSVLRTASVRLLALTPDHGRLVPIANPQTFRVRSRKRGEHTLRLAINHAGRLTLSTCFATDVTLVVRARGFGSPGLRTRRHLRLREQRFRFVCMHGQLTPVPLSSSAGFGPQSETGLVPGASGSAGAVATATPGGNPTAPESTVGAPTGSGGPAPSVGARRSYFAGVAAEPINPCPDGSWSVSADPTRDPQCPGDSRYVFLGGYGFGGGPVGQCPLCTSNPAAGRPTTGPLMSTDPSLKDADGAHVRSIAVSDGKHPLLVANMEVQGWFVADKNNKTGIIDMRNRVAKALAIDAQQIFVQSDHSHSGADALGVWGGVPESFLEYMANQTVKSLISAYISRQPADLFYGSVDANKRPDSAPLLNNQFAGDPVNDTLDSDLRVLQARGEDGKPFATLVNFSAHATELGGDNRKLSGDWLQATNPLLERRFGGQAMTLVGTVGRSQPRRDEAAGACPGAGSDPKVAFCSIEHYGAQVTAAAADALANAKPLDGAKPSIDAHSYLIQDPATNGAILGFDLLPGGAVGLPFIRSTNPPWLTANFLGTVTGTARIGDVLLSSMPGEAYPQIPLKVRDTVTGIRNGPGQDGFMTAGLSNDQLGYIIGPVEAYPQPVQRTLFSAPLTQDVIQGCVSSPNPGAFNPTSPQDSFAGCPQPSPLSNDNYFFNVSHTLGERLTCSLLRGADDVTHPGQTGFRDSYQRCLLFANDAVMAPGADIALGNQIPQAPGVVGGQNPPG